MPRNIAILVQDETMANQGFLQAFAQQGTEVTCIVCNDLLPVALQMAKPDFAIVNGNAWHEAGDAQELLDSMGIPYLGAGAATIRRCRDAAQLSYIIEEALAQGSIDAGKVKQLTLAPSVQGALLQTGQLSSIVANTFAPGEPLTLRADGAEFLNPGVAVQDQKELSEALIAFKDAGKRAVVLGRSTIVGKPMALMLIANDATVTICHSRTPNKAETSQQADIVISAIGHANLVKSDWMREGAVVVDVGMNRDENGKLCGDVAYDEVAAKASAITPVPGGVGPMTRAMLMLNCVTAAERLAGMDSAWAQ